MSLRAFPIAKVVVLGIKQITKPVSRLFKDIAKQNRLFKSYVCAPAGQFINWMDLRFKMHTLGLRQPKRVPRITEHMAVEMGSNFLSEVVVLCIGLGLIYFEVSRQSHKDKKKHERQENRKIELQMKLNELNKILDLQDEEIHKIRERLY